MKNEKRERNSDVRGITCPAGPIPDRVAVAAGSRVCKRSISQVSLPLAHLVARSRRRPSLRKHDYAIRRIRTSADCPRTRTCNGTSVRICVRAVRDSH